MISWKNKIGFIITLVMVAMCWNLLGCCDDDSSVSVEEISSSSEDESSSSKKAESSSSKVKISSSSSVASSSSEKMYSSSEEVSSSSVEESSSSIKDNWQYLNVNIDYGEFTDVRDSQVYRTVKIGEQTWMAENLNYADYERYPELDYDSSSFCYEDNLDSCFKYGRMYLWDAAMRDCPEGWHLPSDIEWGELFTEVGGSQVVVGFKFAGEKLKSASAWGDEDVSDEYGFAALPGGCTTGYAFDAIGTEACFWSSTEDVYINTWSNFWTFKINNENVSFDGKPKDRRYSVRCLKD